MLEGLFKENQQLELNFEFQGFPLFQKNFPLLTLNFPLLSQLLLLIWETKEKLLRPQLVGFGDLKKILLTKGNSQNNIDDKGYWDSGCSWHMTGNISYLSDYEPYDGGYVSFGQGGGKIIGKGIIKTCKLEFEHVYFVKDLKYNLFSVSQICDNKNSVLFTDSECIVLGKDFKLKDDTSVLLRTPRQHNMYSIDLNNIVPHKDLTCLVAKAFADKSMLWHRRLGHLNFKTMNKLVRHNLVKGLPSKCFENDHTCVACLKGKQHKASCKTKLVNSVSKPLHTLHMDLFGPTSVSSLNHKWFCLFDETSGILRNFITKIENLKDLKVKIIRCDNEADIKNKEMNEFCTRKGIKRESSNAKTPQQNGVAKRRNRTLIEAARTMLADAKLPVTFWAEAVNTAYHLGKFDAKGDEGTSSTNISCTKDIASQGVKKDVSSLRYIALPNWFHEAHMESSNNDAYNRPLYLLSSPQLLAEYLERKKKQLVEERAAAIKNKPPTKTQLRRLMMTYLKNIGRFTHSQLNKKSFEEIQGIYIREQKLIADFVPIRSEEDERMIRDMNKKAEEESSDKESMYLLTTRTLERMPSLRLIAESVSDAAYDLLRFIQNQIDKSRGHDRGEKDI
nr:putative ribonuclease H-like domain-containing protein [Tanacetum cinerariifolium]